MNATLEFPLYNIGIKISDEKKIKIIFKLERSVQGYPSAKLFPFKIVNSENFIHVMMINRHTICTYSEVKQVFGHL